jgi:hypothetical protein
MTNAAGNKAARIPIRQLQWHLIIPSTLSNIKILYAVIRRRQGTLHGSQEHTGERDIMSHDS